MFFKNLWEQLTAMSAYAKVALIGKVLIAAAIIIGIFLIYSVEKKRFKFFTRATKEGYFKTTVINNVKPVEKKVEVPVATPVEQPVVAAPVQEEAPVAEEPVTVCECCKCEQVAEEPVVEEAVEEVVEPVCEQTEVVEETVEEPVAEEVPVAVSEPVEVCECCECEQVAEEPVVEETVEEVVEPVCEVAVSEEPCECCECEEVPEAEVEIIAPETESVSEEYEKEDAFNFNAIKKTIDEKYEMLDATSKNYYNDILAYAEEKQGVKRTKSLVAETVIFGRDSIIKVQIKQSKVVCSFSMLTTETKQRFIDENIKQVREKLTVVRISDEDSYRLAKHCVDLAYRISEENKEAKHQKQLEKRREARRAKKAAQED